MILVSWGKGPQNPVKFVHFYNKGNTHVEKSSEELEISVMLPKNYEEIQVHVLSRRPDDFAVDVIRLCYDNYWHDSSAKCNNHVF